MPTVTGVAPLDFSVEIAKFSSGFSGRQWLTGELDRWLATDTRRAFVIVAPPGVGKSSIAAWLSLTRRDVVGVHFCTQQNTRSRDPYEFVACLVGQLHARLPGFAEAVQTKHPGLRRATAADAFRELIVEAARNLTSPHARLIIIDSLDEAATHENETVLDVLVRQAPDLPSWLRVVATTRPEESILKRIKNLSVFELHADRSENRADLREFISARLVTPPLASVAGPEIHSVALRIESLAEGNFLYARLALDALEEGILAVGDLGRLTPGLAVFYTEAFSRRFRDIESYERDYAPLLRALAAARAPLSFTLLQRICGEPVEKLHRRLLDLRTYLRALGEGESASYALFHKSLQDWLTDRDAAGDYWSPAAAGHDRLADVLLSDWRDDEYAMRHVPAHLLAAKRWADLEGVLTDPIFVEAKCAAGMTYDLVGDYRATLDALPEAQEEREREHTVAYNSTRPGRIRAFSRLVNAQSHHLMRYGGRRGFCAQQAYNLMSNGPVAEAFDPVVTAPDFNVAALLRRAGSRANYEARPALLRTLEGHTGMSPR